MEHKLYSIQLNAKWLMRLRNSQKGMGVMCTSKPPEALSLSTRGEQNSINSGYVQYVHFIVMHVNLFQHYTLMMLPIIADYGV